MYRLGPMDNVSILIILIVLRLGVQVQIVEGILELLVVVLILLLVPL